MAGPEFIAVDWGTTRLRASLVGAAGDVLARAEADSGVQSVPPGGFPAALAAVCGAWFTAHPAIPVVMAGMVGSRNGWIEAPYLRSPCSLADLARGLIAVPGQDREILIVPGVDTRPADGGYDVMRGEETQVFGCALADGVVCLPGTHSKWVVVEAGRIVRFVTFITGEFFAAMSQSFVARLATTPEDPEAGRAAARSAGAARGGLSRALFQARTRVLAGDMPPGAVRPFLSELLIEAELDGAADLFGRPDRLVLVAGEAQSGLYGDALAARGIAVEPVDPARATLEGLQRLMAARRHHG